MLWLLALGTLVLGIWWGPLQAWTAKAQF